MDLHKLRHSTAHVLASAIKELYPKAKLAIGPDIEEGFYYDFDNLDITEKDLPKIEKKIQEIIDKKSNFKKSYKSKEEAKKILRQEPYKLELLKEIDKPSFYQHGKFIDLCSGPHIKNTSQIKAFKLLKLAGAYWRGNSKNKMLTRIYGISFPTKKFSIPSRNIFSPRPNINGFVSKFKFASFKSSFIFESKTCPSFTFPVNSISIKSPFFKAILVFH